MLYTNLIIDKAGSWMENSQPAKLWLQQNKLEELVQLKDAVSRYPKAFEYLLVNKHIVLATFVNAIWDDKKAFSLLMQNKQFHWAAMANLINGDDKAAEFLTKSNFRHYAEFAYKIQAKIRKEGDDGTNYFNSGPFKIER